MCGCPARPWITYPPGVKRKLLRLVEETVATLSETVSDFKILPWGPTIHHLPLAAVHAYSLHPVGGLLAYRIIGHLQVTYLQINSYEDIVRKSSFVITVFQYNENHSYNK